jgi:predicted protein tyrosine phosphatase
LNLIRFVSRRVAGGSPAAPGIPVISIHDRSEPALELQPGWADVLVQRFHDTDGTLMGLEVFSEAQARDVLAFAARHRGCVELTVHCQQGQSRSAAIALYLAEKYGIPCYQGMDAVTRATWKFYNRLVYQRLSHVDHGAQ